MLVCSGVFSLLSLHGRNFICSIAQELLVTSAQIKGAGRSAKGGSGKNESCRRSANKRRAVKQ